MITAVWSDDPEFYEAITGGDEMLEKIFVKINFCDTDQIIQRFNLSPVSEEVFVKSDKYKYICVKTNQSMKTAVEMVKQAKLEAV
jgi:hypothetical protein